MRLSGPPFAALRSLVLPLLLGLVTPATEAASADKPGPRPDSAAIAPKPKPAPQPPRSFKTYLPKPGMDVKEPASRVVQLLLDLQEKDGFESYLIQVLFHGKPATAHTHRVYPDRVEIDFLDTGKPAMRLAKIRGGALEGTSMEELYYRDAAVLKKLVRLTLYLHEKAELRFRSTLDRTLIHFRLPKPNTNGR